MLKTTEFAGLSKMNWLLNCNSANDPSPDMLKIPSTTEVDLALAAGDETLKEDSGLLAEAVRIGEQLQILTERMAATMASATSPELSSPIGTFQIGQADPERVKRLIQPLLPDPRLVRRVIRNRQLRAKHFDPHLFADPAWDMLLDLTAARAEHRRVSVTSLCIASGVPSTTALRWIGEMVKQGLFMRIGDQTDRRRAFIELSNHCADTMAAYFAETGTDAHR